MLVKNLILILLAFIMDATDADNNMGSQAFSAAGANREKHIGYYSFTAG